MTHIDEIKALKLEIETLKLKIRQDDPRWNENNASRIQNEESSLYGDENDENITLSSQYNDAGEPMHWN